MGSYCKVQPLKNMRWHFICLFIFTLTSCETHILINMMKSGAWIFKMSTNLLYITRILITLHGWLDVLTYPCLSCLVNILLMQTCSHLLEQLPYVSQPHGHSKHDVISQGRVFGESYMIRWAAQWARPDVCNLGSLLATDETDAAC